MAKLISKTYGEALFELAVENGKVDDFMDEITAVRKIMKENPEFERLMNHPKILKEEKIQVIENVFRGRIMPELTGFFTLVIQKDRYGDIDAILDYFLTEVKKLKGIGVAYVCTAAPLTEEQKRQITAKLLETTQFKQMEMHYSVDAGMIGGMIIRIGDRVVDSSVRTKLDELQRQLLKIQLG